jgi:hypothetical protein
MGDKETRGRPREAARPELPGTAGGDPPAWEMIEPGRYMPRRIRGSYPGRELG